MSPNPSDRLPISPLLWALLIASTTHPFQSALPTQSKDRFTLIAHSVIFLFSSLLPCALLCPITALTLSEELYDAYGPHAICAASLCGFLGDAVVEWLTTERKQSFFTRRRCFFWLLTAWQTVLVTSIHCKLLDRIDDRNYFTVAKSVPAKLINIANEDGLAMFIFTYTFFRVWQCVKLCWVSVYVAFREPASQIVFEESSTLGPELEAAATSKSVPKTEQGVIMKPSDDTNVKISMVQKLVDRIDRQAEQIAKLETKSAAGAKSDTDEIDAKIDAALQKLLKSRRDEDEEKYADRESSLRSLITTQNGDTISLKKQVDAGDKVLATTRKEMGKLEQSLERINAEWEAKTKATESEFQKVQDSLRSSDENFELTAATYTKFIRIYDVEHHKILAEIDDLGSKVTFQKEVIDSTAKWTKWLKDEAHPELIKRQDKWQAALEDLQGFRSAQETINKSTAESVSWLKVQFNGIMDDNIKWRLHLAKFLDKTHSDLHSADLTLLERIEALEAARKASDQSTERLEKLEEFQAGISEQAFVLPSQLADYVTKTALVDQLKTSVDDKDFLPRDEFRNHDLIKNAEARKSDGTQPNLIDISSSLDDGAVWDPKPARGTTLKALSQRITDRSTLATADGSDTPYQNDAGYMENVWVKRLSQIPQTISQQADRSSPITEQPTAQNERREDPDFGPLEVHEICDFDLIAPPPLVAPFLSRNHTHHDNTAISGISKADEIDLSKLFSMIPSSESQDHTEGDATGTNEDSKADEDSASGAVAIPRPSASQDHKVDNVAGAHEDSKADGGTVTGTMLMSSQLSTQDPARGYAMVAPANANAEDLAVQEISASLLSLRLQNDPLATTVVNHRDSNVSEANIAEHFPAPGPSLNTGEQAESTDPATSTPNANQLPNSEGTQKVKVIDSAAADLFFLFDIVPEQSSEQAYQVEVVHSAAGEPEVTSNINPNLPAERGEQVKVVDTTADISKFTFPSTLQPASGLSSRCDVDRYIVGDSLGMDFSDPISGTDSNSGGNRGIAPKCDTNLDPSANGQNVWPSRPPFASETSIGGGQIYAPPDRAESQETAQERSSSPGPRADAPAKVLPTRKVLSPTKRLKKNPQALLPLYETVNARILFGAPEVHDEPGNPIKPDDDTVKNSNSEHQETVVTLQPNVSNKVAQVSSAPAASEVETVPSSGSSPNGDPVPASATADLRGSRNADSATNAVAAQSTDQVLTTSAASDQEHDTASLPNLLTETITPISRSAQNVLPKLFALAPPTTSAVSSLSQASIAASAQQSSSSSTNTGTNPAGGPAATAKPIRRQVPPPPRPYAKLTGEELKNALAIPKPRQRVRRPQRAGPSSQAAPAAPAETAKTVEGDAEPTKEITPPSDDEKAGEE